jgi:preprotein translocase subunit SecE
MNIKQKSITYFEETVVELKKVSWPSKDEIYGSTVVVIITSIILSAFVMIVDRGLGMLVRTILS